jgi:hypothetical protein
VQLIDNGVELSEGDTFFVRTKEGHSLFLVMEHGRLTISNEKVCPSLVIEANDEGYEWLDTTPREVPMDHDEPEEREAYRVCAAKCGATFHLDGGYDTPLGLMCQECKKAFDGYASDVMEVLTGANRVRMPAPPQRLSKLMCPGGIE